MRLTIAKRWGRPDGGWTDSRAYPLLVSSEVDMAVTRYRADKGLSLGKAYNELIRIGLFATGYMIDPGKCDHTWAYREVNGCKILRCSRCGAKPTPEQYSLASKQLDHAPIARSGSI